MNLRQHHLRKHTALLLLVVFVFGGLLGPVLHRASHGMQWADLRGPSSTATDGAEACDHDAHADRFEVTIPALHDELCPLCTRHLVTLDGLATPSASLYGVDVAVSFSTERVPTSPSTSHLIRGPPYHT